MKWLVVLLFCFYGEGLQAQTWSEWTQQKKTQKKYLLQQIAALKIYLDYGKQGYAIARQGLTAIDKIKSGDFSLHQDYFESLAKVNPAIRNYVRVGEVIAKHIQLIKAISTILSHLEQSAQLTSEEIKYCQELLRNIISDGVADVEELLLVLSSEYQMKDDERIEVIERLYATSTERFEFAISCTNEIKLLLLRRVAEQAEIDLSKKLNGVK
jgi:hypothetical protein